MRRGRPAKGHVGHRGPIEGCAPCLLREWRQARGLTQAQLAHRLPGHVHMRTVQRWERGECPIPAWVVRNSVQEPVTRPAETETPAGRG